MSRDDRAMVRAAKLYYNHGLTHKEVAGELGMSRVKVTRLLAQARRVGVVKIEVFGEGRPYEDLEQLLVERWGRHGLRVARVAPTIEEERQGQAVSQDGAELLQELTGDIHSVTVGVSTAVAEVLAQLDEAVPADITVTPLAGGWAGRSRQLNPDNLASRLAAALGGRSYSMTAPLVARSADLARSLYAQDGVQQVLERAMTSDLLVAGVGSGPGGSAWDDALLARAISEEELAELVAKGAVGDISGRFFDSAGTAIDSGVDARVIGMRLDQMKEIPRRLIVAHGAHKVSSLRASLIGGLATMVVTDRATAQQLLP